MLSKSPLKDDKEVDVAQTIMQIVSVLIIGDHSLQKTAFDAGAVDQIKNLVQSKHCSKRVNGLLDELMHDDGKGVAPDSTSLPESVINCLSSLTECVELAREAVILDTRLL